MLNPCITINNKNTKHREGRCEAGCAAHLKRNSEVEHVAQRELLQYLHLWLSRSPLVRSMEAVGPGLPAWLDRGSDLRAAVSLPVQTAHLASQGQGKHGLPLVGYLHAQWARAARPGTRRAPIGQQRGPMVRRLETLNRAGSARFKARVGVILSQWSSVQPQLCFQMPRR